MQKKDGCILPQAAEKGNPAQREKSTKKRTKRPGELPKERSPPGHTCSKGKRGRPKAFLKKARPPVAADDPVREKDSQGLDSSFDE